MAETPKHPHLRLVPESGEKASAAPPPEPAAPSPESAPPSSAPQSVSPSAEQVAVARVVQAVDASIPLRAGYLVCAGLRLVDTALDFHHQAAAHAKPGTFRKDIPPGLKSAEATRAWLKKHLDDIKALTDKSYASGKDLREAVVLAASELDRAYGATKAAGLWFEDRRTKVFEEALAEISRKAPVSVLEVPVPQETVGLSVVASRYLSGCNEIVTLGYTVPRITQEFLIGILVGAILAG